MRLIDWERVNSGVRCERGKENEEEWLHDCGMIHEARKEGGGRARGGKARRVPMSTLLVTGSRRPRTK